MFLGPPAVLLPRQPTNPGTICSIGERISDALALQRHMRALGPYQSAGRLKIILLHFLLDRCAQSGGIECVININYFIRLSVSDILLLFRLAFI